MNKDVFKGALMDVDHIIEAQANATLDDAINEAHKDT